MLNFKKTELSKQEIRVSKLLISGKSGMEISKILNLSPLTIQEHQKNIKRKLNSDGPYQTGALLMFLLFNSKLELNYP